MRRDSFVDPEKGHGVWLISSKPYPDHIPDFDIFSAKQLFYLFAPIFKCYIWLCFRLLRAASFDPVGRLRSMSGIVFEGIASFHLVSSSSRIQVFNRKSWILMAATGVHTSFEDRELMPVMIIELCSRSFLIGCSPIIARQCGDPRQQRLRSRG